MDEIRAEVWNDEYSGDYKVNIYFPKNEIAEIRELQKEEAELIAERINFPNKVVEVVEGMKKETKTIRKRGAICSSVELKYDERTLDELLKRIKGI